MGFARREGCGGIDVINLYALRATKPVHLLDHPDPEGPDNCLAWADVLYDEPVALVVAAWGAGALDPLLPKSKALWGCVAPFHCLGTTKEGAPRHPLYVRSDQPLERWSWPPNTSSAQCLTCSPRCHCPSPKKEGADA